MCAVHGQEKSSFVFRRENWSTEKIGIETLAIFHTCRWRRRHRPRCFCNVLRTQLIGIWHSHRTYSIAPDAHRNSIIVCRKRMGILQWIQMQQENGKWLRFFFFVVNRIMYIVRGNTWWLHLRSFIQKNNLFINLTVVNCETKMMQNLFFRIIFFIVSYTYGRYTILYYTISRCLECISSRWMWAFVWGMSIQ